MSSVVRSDGRLLSRVWFSVLRRVVGEDEVVSFGRFVAGRAGLGHNAGRGFAIAKLSEAPAVGRGVFF
jgi:hypothetical protein